MVLLGGCASGRRWDGGFTISAQLEEEFCNMLSPRGWKPVGLFSLLLQSSVRSREGDLGASLCLLQLG